MASQQLQKGQRFRFKEPQQAVEFFNPFSRREYGRNLDVPAAHRPYKPELYGRTVDIPTDEVFVVHGAYGALGGWAVTARSTVRELDPFDPELYFQVHFFQWDDALRQYPNPPEPTDPQFVDVEIVG